MKKQFGDFATTMAFETPDIIRIIYNFLDLPTISAIGCVNKLFSQITKEFYNDRLNIEIIALAKERLNNFEKDANEIINMQTITNSRLKELFYSFEIFIKPFVTTNLWIVLVNDFIFMETLFKICTRVEYWILQVSHYYGRLCTRDTQYIEYFYTFNKYFDILDNYFYIEFPSKYTVGELRKFAKFKKIKKWPTKTRRELLNSLRRPANEIYFV